MPNVQGPMLFPLKKTMISAHNMQPFVPVPGPLTQFSILIRGCYLVSFSCPPVSIDRIGSDQIYVFKFVLD